MCIALHKKAGITLPRQTYLNCFNSNQDGAGFAYALDGKIHVQKGFFDFDEFYREFIKHEQHDAIVHFRIGTAGPNDVFNCHPWAVIDCYRGFEFAIIHNGILSYPHSTEKSDTGHFVDEVFGPILQRDPWFLDSKPGIYLLEEKLGHGNKMVVLRSDGKVYVLNRDNGIESDGVWFSNYGFRGLSIGASLSFGSARRADACPNPLDDWTSFMARKYPLAKTATAPTQTKMPRTSSKILPHLTRAERKRLFEMAAALYGDEGLTGVPLLERIRDAFIDANPHNALLPVTQLDIEIVKSSFAQLT